jgi:hypothetical protein
MTHKKTLEHITFPQGHHRCLSISPVLYCSSVTPRHLSQLGTNWHQVTLDIQSAVYLQHLHTAYQPGAPTVVWREGVSGPPATHHLTPNYVRLFELLKKHLTGMCFRTDSDLQHTATGTLHQFLPCQDRCLGVKVEQILSHLWQFCRKVICTGVFLCVTNVNKHLCKSFT